MSLFLNSIADLRQYVSAIQDGPSFSAYAPTVKQVTRYYIEPLFPKVLREKLIANTDLTPTETALRDFLREAIACFTAFKYSFSGAIVQTGSGLQHFEGEQFKTAYKYEKEDYRGYFEETGFVVLEEALKFAVMNKDSIEGYAASNEYAKAVSRLVNFTSDFEGCGYQIGRKTLALLLPHIALIEREVIENVLTPTLYDELKTLQYTEGGLSLTPKKKQLLSLYREGVAQYALQLAMDLSLIHFVGNQVFIKEHTGDDANSQRTLPKMDVYSRVQETRNDYAARYLAQAKKYLVDNAIALGWTAPPVTEGVSNPTPFLRVLKKMEL